MVRWVCVSVDSFCFCRKFISNCQSAIGNSNEPALYDIRGDIFWYSQVLSNLLCLFLSSPTQFRWCNICKLNVTCLVILRCGQRW